MAIPTTARNSIMLVFLIILSIGHLPMYASLDYKDALGKSIIYFEQQRSGRLPWNQRAKWRGNSAMKDGSAAGVNLTGGYYDAGDNVKFGFPMAFTVTVLSWSLIEFNQQIKDAGQTGHLRNAIKWGTDYFRKAHPEANVLYGQVGDGKTDHDCWMRPEDMTIPRGVYKIDKNNPGSELAGETSAAMASSSIVFRTIYPKYSASLLRHARQLFTFADKYRRNYTLSIREAREFYGTYSGYNDELLWAATWLYLATNEASYLKYIVDNADSLNGATAESIEFSWDNKYIGVQIIMAKVFMSGKAKQYNYALRRYKTMADKYVCTAMGLSPQAPRQLRRTKAGMLYYGAWNPIQYATAASLALTVYSDGLKRRGQNVWCPGMRLTPENIQKFVKSQADYILGSNPMKMSYMVGFGGKYPLRGHHRASSLPSVRKYPQHIPCGKGFDYFHTSTPNPNVLVGALVGGPNKDDYFDDRRDNYKSAESTTYMNACFVGVLARVWGGFKGTGQLWAPGLKG